MPTVPYTPYPTVPTPTLGGPRPEYQDISARPEMFGEQVGHSMVALGGVLAKSADDFAKLTLERQDLHNQVVADSQTNNWSDQAIQKEIAYKARTGKDALDNYQPFLDDLGTSRTAMRQQLTNPYQQLEFDRNTRRELQSIMFRAGAHYDQQHTVFQDETNKNGGILARQKMTVAANAGDTAGFDNAVREARQFGLQELQAKGLDQDATSVAAMEGLVRGDAAAIQVEALSVKDPVAARTMLQQNAGIIPQEKYDRLDNQLAAKEARAEREANKAAIAAATATIMGGAAPPAEGGAVGGPAPVQGGAAHEKASENVQHFNFAGMRALGGGWQSFGSTEEGIRAISTQLDRYASGATTGTPLRNIKDIVTEWAPPKENPTALLIARAAKYMGVDPQTSLDLSNPETKQKLVEATIMNEHGGKLIVPSSTIQSALAGRPQAQAAGAAPSAPVRLAAAGGTPLSPETIKTLKEGRMSDAEIARVQAATSAPGAAPVVPATAAGPQPVAQPIPPSPQPARAAAPVDNLRPDFEGMEERAYATFPDETVRRGVLMNIQRGKSVWNLATATDRRQTLDDVRNTISQRMAGQDVPDVDEARIRHLFPKDGAGGADDLIEKLADSKIYGDMVNHLNTQTFSEIVNQRAMLAAARGVPGIHDVETRIRAAEVYRHESQNVMDAMAGNPKTGQGADPAGRLGSVNPDLRSLNETLSALPAPQSDTDPNWSAYTQAHERYATAMQGAQQQWWGNPNMETHVLSATQAGQLAHQLTTDPAGAPNLMRLLQRTWGAAWPAVWHDMSTLGKLSTAAQAIGILPPDMGRRMAQGIADEQGGEEREGKGNRVWEERFGAPVVTGAQGVIQSIQKSPHITRFMTSMRTGGASAPQQASVIHAMSTLAFSLMAHAGEDQSNAVDKAIHAFTDLYEYMPNGGARVPTRQMLAVSATANNITQGLSETAAQVPDGYGKPGQPTVQDYFAAIKANPTWVNEGEGVALIDNASRHVVGRDGNRIWVPFNTPMPAGVLEETPPGLGAVPF